MTNSTQLTLHDLGTVLDATDSAAATSLNRIYGALGNMLNGINTALVDNPALRDQMEAHLIVIDEESRSLKETVSAFTGEMTALARFVEEIRNQRDDALWEIKDMADRLDSAEADAQERFYGSVLDNIQETFNCTRQSADKIMSAIWDAHSKVDDATAEMLDSIANVIDERENGY